ncbi:S8 family serine peptidase [Streptomyces sodiiphilus]
MGLLCVASGVSPASAEGASRGWYFDRYRIDEVWEHSDGEGVTVAVIDTGVDASVPELQGQVLEGKDFVTESGNGHLDAHGHGTGMASLIAGTGVGGGVQGVAPGAKILPVRVYSRFGEIDFGFHKRLAQAIDFAANSDAQILSIAVGDAAEFTSYQDELDAAIEEALRKDKLIFVAVGNGGDEGNRGDLAAVQDGTVAVAAVDRSGERTSYSVHGEFVGLAAPGKDVLLRCDSPSADLCVRDGGTSSASALASASAALIWSANPEWTKNQVLRVMMETADGPSKTPRNHYVGYGVVRPDRVILDGEGDPGDPDVNPLFERYEAELDPPATPEPSVGEREGEQEEGSGSADESEADTSGAGEQAAGSGGGVGGPAVLFGLAGGVIVAGGLAAWWMRRRQGGGSA